MAWSVKRLLIECPFSGCRNTWKIALAAWNKNRCAKCPKCRRRIEYAWMVTGQNSIRPVKVGGA